MKSSFQYYIYYFACSLIHSWRTIEDILDQCKNYKEVSSLAKKYYEQNKPRPLAKHEVALNQLINPNFKNAFFNYIEKSRLYLHICQISLVRKSQQPAPIGITTGRSSPYFHIMNYVWLKRIESIIRTRIRESGCSKRIKACPIRIRGTPLGLSN